MGTWGYLQTRTTGCTPPPAAPPPPMPPRNLGEGGQRTAGLKCWHPPASSSAAMSPHSPCSPPAPPRPTTATGLGEAGCAPRLRLLPYIYIYLGGGLPFEEEEEGEKNPSLWVALIRGVSEERKNRGERGEKTNWKAHMRQCNWMSEQGL